MIWDRIVTAPLLVFVGLVKAYCGIEMPGVVPPPRAMVPPEKVAGPEAWKFRLSAESVPETVTVYGLFPLAVPAPATK